jgi:hypothetical protein
MRYCLWLKDATPDIIRHPYIKERVERVKDIRLTSKREATQKLSLFPYLFGEDRQPNTSYLMIPRVSSERRRYIPIGYLEKDIIASDACLIIPMADLYMFGILNSNVHNSWMRVVAGRLKSDYRYSAKIVYNNFPWPAPTKEIKERVEKTAEEIIEARKKYSQNSLADLYDETSMPPELRKAHQNNDRAVMAAYGISNKDEAFKSETACVAMLMKLHQAKTADQQEIMVSE